MYLSVQETAELLSISEMKVKNLILQNQIRPFMMGRIILLTRSNLIRILSKWKNIKRL